MQSQQSIDRWLADFDACASVKPFSLLSAELLELVLPAAEDEDAAEHSLRSERVYAAFSYAARNAQAFENIGELQRKGPNEGLLSVRVVFALYLFFGSGLCGNRQPDLDLVIDAMLRFPELS